MQAKADVARRLETSRYDVILADYTLPGWIGMDALQMVRQRQEEVPFIVVTGTIGADLAVECVKKGASDFVLKDKLVRLPLAVRRALQGKAIKEQRNCALNELAASEEKFRSLIETSPDAIFVVSQDKLVFCNPATTKLLGASTAEQLIGKDAFDIVHPDCLADIKQRIKLSLQQRLPLPAAEQVLVRLDGTPVTVESVSIPFVWKGSPAIEVVTRDITQRKLAEQTILDWQKRMELAERAGLGLWEWNIETDTRTWLGAVYRQMYGRGNSSSMEQFLARVHPEDRLRVEKALRELAAGNATYAEEFRVVKPDGTVLWVDSRAAVVPGHPSRIVGIAIDITFRKRAEEELRIREKQIAHLASFTEHNPEPIFETDLQGKVTYANSAAETLFPELMSAGAGHPLLHDWPGITARLMNNCGQRLEREIEAGGLIFLQENHCSPSLGVVRSYLIDITRRKRNEEQLKTTAARLRAIMQHAPIGIDIVDRETRIIESNTTYQQITGYSEEELRGKSFKEYTHPEDVRSSLELFDTLCGEEAQAYETEKRYIRKDGRTVWVRLRASKLNQEQRIDIVEDITERREALERIKQGEARFRRLIESNVVGVIISSVDGGISDANDAFLKMLGYTRRDLERGLRWRNLSPSEYTALDDASVEEIIRTGSFQPYEKEFIRRDGSRVPVIVGGTLTEGNEAIVFVLDITERKKTQAELQQLARIVESADVAIISLALDGTILSWNKGAERLLGYSQSEIVGTSEDILLPAGNKSEWVSAREAAAQGKGLEEYRTVLTAKNGEQRPVALTISLVRDSGGKVVGISKIVNDRTQVVKAQQLEEQFRQAQKLESLGRLAGGVAHDFNNLLMVISSWAQMLQDELRPEDKLRKNTQQIIKAAGRAASLTQQMLAFSRKQVLAPQSIDLNVIIDETTRMAKRLIREDIELSFLPGRPLSAIEADPGQITQVLLNLCVNARDAMPNGGKLTIQTRDVEVNAREAASIGAAFAPGKYVMIEVKDTGTGISKDVQARIFEPFFTTKPMGQGTGLGLSMVYGVVKQSGGDILVDSEPGRGTSFKLYFPRAEKRMEKKPVELGAMRGLGEVILVVEDEDALREAVCEHLSQNGYIVLHAADGQEALELAQRRAGPIHVLLADVIMPKMSGPELARRLRHWHPRMVTLYMSGYTDDAILDQGILRPGMQLIQKPFSFSTLSRKLRESLGGKTLEAAV